jgi:hypothetical protein
MVHDDLDRGTGRLDMDFNLSDKHQAFAASLPFAHNKLVEGPLQRGLSPAPRATARLLPDQQGVPPADCYVVLS